MSLLLKDKIAVITGCNRGIGRATLELFAMNGADIWACIRKENNDFKKYINKISKEYKVNIWPIYFDLSNTEEINEALKKIISSKKSIDILINNAGIIHTALFQMTPLEKMKEIFDINFFSSSIIIQNISRQMIRQRSGSIINISSSAAIQGNIGLGAYSASKAALISLTKVLAKELGGHNIRVNAIAPGFIETDLMRESTSEMVLQSSLDRISLSRVGSPREIANILLFLASENSSYINGQVISADGGM